MLYSGLKPALTLCYMLLFGNITFDLKENPPLRVFPFFLNLIQNFNVLEDQSCQAEGSLQQYTAKTPKAFHR